MASALAEHWQWLFAIAFGIWFHWKTESWKGM